MSNEEAKSQRFSTSHVLQARESESWVRAGRRRKTPRRHEYKHVRSFLPKPKPFCRLAVGCVRYIYGLENSSSPVQPTTFADGTVELTLRQPAPELIEVTVVEAAVPLRAIGRSVDPSDVYSK